VHGKRGCNRFARSMERSAERVADRLEDVTAIAFDRGAHQIIMEPQARGHRLTVLLPALRASFDIAEQKCDRPRRGIVACRHSGTLTTQKTARPAEQRKRPALLRASPLTRRLAALPQTLPIRGRTRREAIAAVNRLVAARLERHFGRLSALAAGRLEHLAATATRRSAASAVASAAATAAGSTLSLTGGAAFRATIGLVLEAFAREELLFAGAKNELAVAINAAQGFICVHYWGLSLGI